MKAIQCSHSEGEPKWQICQHLLRQVGKSYDSTGLSHFRRFTGKGSDYVLLCPDCAMDSEHVASHLRWVCANCFGHVAVSGKRLGVQGSLEIRQRDAGLRLEHRQLQLSKSPGKLLAVATSSGSNGHCWLALNDRRELIALDAEAGEFQQLLLLDELGVPTDQPLELTASTTGQYAIIASATGSHGIVTDLWSGKTTMRLNRGDYHVEHCRFPAAFFEHEGRSLLVHATDWNRLDVSDPSNGKLLTARQPTSYREGEKRPEHYLDYFHCGLSVSPDGEWIADDGWVWHPLGVISTWSLKRWLENNVWESEDGESKRHLGARDYYWDGPLCWVGRRTLAVWGHGDDDALLVPGIRLFDVETGKELAGFAGPVVGAASTDQLTTKGTILFDEYLFSFDRDCEFAVWDVTTGERLLCDENFLPIGYQRGTKTFLSQNLDGSIRLTKLLKERP